MVQAEVRWVRNAGLYDSSGAAKVDLFNNYFGGGMGSIVSQTIRESKALAYSTFAAFSSPDRKDKESAVIAYVGTQADKMNEAIAGMNELLTTFPESEKAFMLSKENSITSLETSRISNENIIINFLADKKLGFDHDRRIYSYSAMKKLSLSDINLFHKNNISGKSYAYCIVGSKSKISLADLARLGVVQQISPEMIFGY